MQVVKKSDRRSFLKSAGMFVMGLSGFTLLYKYLTPDLPDDDIIAEADVANIPDGGALIFQDKQLALLRKDDEISAMSLSCTHLGCTVSLDGETFACPCHGSIFALNGDVIKGPAQKSLKKFAFEQKEGKIRIFRRGAV